MSEENKCESCGIYLSDTSNSVYLPRTLCADCVILRNKFAAAALKGALANPNYDYTNEFDLLAEDSFRVADAMMKARKGGD